MVKRADDIQIPEKALVFVEPETTSWGRRFKELVGALVCGKEDGVRDTLKALGKKWLSEGIVCLDGSRFSHVAIRRGDKVIDAQLRSVEATDEALEGAAGRIPDSVSMYDYAWLEGLPRALSFSEPIRNEVIDRIWRAIPASLVGRGSRPAPYPGPGDIRLPSEHDSFSIAGLLRIGRLLVMKGGPIRRRIGRWLVRRHEDAAGMFCSELVAKAFLEAGERLEVPIPADRLPASGSLDEEALIDLVVRRKEVNFSRSAIEALGESDLRRTVRSNLEAIRATPVANDGAILVEVGYLGATDGKYPPSLVTPGELFQSPQLRHVANRSPQGDIVQGRPDLPTEERKCRCRTWAGVSGLAGLLALAGTKVHLNCVLPGRRRRKGRALPDPG